MARRVAKKPTEPERAPVGEAEWDEERQGWSYPNGQFVEKLPNGPFPSDPKGGVKTPPKRGRKTLGEVKAAIAAASVEDPRSPRVLKSTITDPKATRVYTFSRFAIVARELATIRPGDAVWGDLTLTNRFAGAIVRIEPPDEATPEQVHALETKLSGIAAAVKVLPRGSSPAVVVQSVAVPWDQRLTQRQRVEKVVEDANSADIDALRALCVDVMDEVGL